MFNVLFDELFNVLLHNFLLIGAMKQEVKEEKCCQSNFEY